MSSVQIIVTMPDSSQVTQTVTVADPDMTRLTNALLARYAAVNGVPATPAWATAKWIEDAIVTLLNTVQTYESQVAIATATAKVKLISTTLAQSLQQERKYDCCFVY